MLDYCWSGQKEFPFNFNVVGFVPCLSRFNTSILCPPTKSASGQTFTLRILFLDIFPTAKQEMVFLNREREGGGGQFFINNNDDKVCQWLSPIQVCVSSVFSPSVLRGRDKDDSFMRQPAEKRALLTSLRGFGQNP